MTHVTFLLAAVVLAVTPGPGMTYVVARTVAGGRREGLASCLGTGLGGLLHVLAAAVGLSVVVARSATAFGVVKYAGAAYLVYLGVRMLMRRTQAAAPSSGASRGPRRALVEGIAVEALNVKTALFFLAFLPQFTSPDKALAPQIVLLGGVCVFLNTLVDVFAALGAHRLLASSNAHERRARWLTRASGSTMIALGTLVAFAKRNS
jgi:threonine/homoserine/homoserine lactone efflux protein